MEDFLIENCFHKVDNIYSRIELGGKYINNVYINENTVTIEDEKNNIYTTISFTNEDELKDILIKNNLLSFY